MKNLSIFEPQIEKHHAYKKTCITPYIDVWQLSDRVVYSDIGADTCIPKQVSDFQLMIIQ